MAAARKPALGLDPRVAAGPPEAVVKEKRSYTGAFLKPVLERRGVEGKQGPRRRNDDRPLVARRRIPQVGG
jgi:hypothetical protein